MMPFAWWRRHKYRGMEKEIEGLIYWIRKDKCPDCKGTGFWEGPRGGININIFCKNAECRSGFNIAVFAGEVLMAERIHKGEDRYYANKTG